MGKVGKFNICFRQEHLTSHAGMVRLQDFARRFGGGGLEVLQAVATKLREENYLPIIFDFDRPADRNYTETVKTLVGLARFVIVDLSGLSVPQELYATVPHFKIPFVPILKEARNPYAMSVDIFEYPWVVRPPISFSSIEDLIEKIPYPSGKAD